MFSIVMIINTMLYFNLRNNMVEKKKEKARKSFWSRKSESCTPYKTFPDTGGAGIFFATFLYSGNNAISQNSKVQSEL